MLDYYKNYLKNLSVNPNEEYRNLQQAIVDSCFDNTTLLKTIEEENNFDFIFNPIEVWLGTVTDAISNSEKDVRDYRYLYFQDCSHDVPRGKYYHFDDNYWLVYESSTELESLSNCKVRRCNNKLKWIDKNNGKEIEYPCILDYSLSSPSMQVTKNINTANSHVTIIVQGNKDTLKLEKNQRFLFNEIPYRYVAINNYMQTDYISEKVPLLFLDCYLDIQQEDDNLQDNIANTNDYNYSIKILEESFEQTKGFKGTLRAIVTLNGQEVNREIIWYSNDSNIILINNNGDYELIGNNGEIGTVFAEIKDSNIQTSINIKITENLSNKNDIVIEPIVQEIGLYDTVIINANLYKDGIKTDEKVECKIENLDSTYYQLIDNLDNSFSLTNNKSSKIPLELSFYCNDYKETIKIKLASLF